MTDASAYEELAAEEFADRRRWRWALLAAALAHLLLLAVPIPQWGGTGTAPPAAERAVFRLQAFAFTPPPPPPPTPLPGVGEAAAEDELGNRPPAPRIDLLLPESPDRRLLPPQAVIAEPPVYPQAAWERGDGGTVVLRLLLDQGGGVVEVTVEDGPEELAEAALAAVRGWTFLPANLDGIAVPAAVSVRVRFAARVGGRSTGERGGGEEDGEGR